MVVDWYGSILLYFKWAADLEIISQQLGLVSFSRVSSFTIVIVRSNITFQQNLQKRLAVISSKDIRIRWFKVNIRYIIIRVGNLQNGDKYVLI